VGSSHFTIRARWPHRVPDPDRNILKEVLWMKERDYDTSQRRIATDNQCSNVRMNDKTISMPCIQTIDLGA
jgi:hypothetical protein